MIPTGLPIFPPIGWYLTINAWVVWVDGEIPSFMVSDTTNDAKSNSLIGHEGLEYIREDIVVNMDTDGDLIEEYLGENEAIPFGYTTGSFIIVPPGGTGVGDRIGGYVEEDP
jgi:hypothetical protein